MAAQLTLDLIEEVLIRFPPDDPASLVRAALVNKPWCRLICGRGFRRRFRAFHGTPPLLGLVSMSYRAERFFVPMSSFRPRDHADRRDMEVMHSNHGRIVLQPGWYCLSEKNLQDLFVWDPITAKLQKLPRWPLYPHLRSQYVAVLCAGTVAAEGCNHLDCHHGPFLVVFVGVNRHWQMLFCVYSSTSNRWSEPSYSDQSDYSFEKGNSVLIGSAIYIKCVTRSTDEHAILKFDLLTQEISLIHVPRVGVLERINHEHIVLMAMEDGRLGFAGMRNWYTLSLWSREHGPDEDARWEQSRVIMLDTLLNKELRWTHVAAIADTGVGRVIFLRSSDTLFSLDLKSGSSKVVPESSGLGCFVPYMTFCTPALGAVSIDEGPAVDETSA